jgi:hypothetical protein
MDLLHDLDVWFAHRFRAEFDETSTHWLATWTPELPLMAVAAYLLMVGCHDRYCIE